MVVGQQVPVGGPGQPDRDFRESTDRDLDAVASALTRPTYAEDVAPYGNAVDRATVRQKKTGQPVRFEMTEQTREAVDDFIRAANKKPGQHLFTADAAATVRLRHGNMLGWSASGSPASGSTQACLAPIRYAEPRPHSFTAEPATCAQCNYC